MEFTDLGVAAGQQFGIQPGGDMFQLFWRDTPGHRVHAVAPTPEVIAAAGRSGALGQPSDGALKGMAMGVDQAGQHRPCQALRALRLVGGRARLHAGPAAIRAHRQQDITRPVAVQPGLRGKEALSHTAWRSCSAQCQAGSAAAAESQRPAQDQRHRGCALACTGSDTSPVAPHAHLAPVRRSGG